MTWQRALGSLSAASSIGLGAYGSHVLPSSPSSTPLSLKQFDTANKYHMFHSLALALVPVATPHPYARLVSGGLFASGMLLFSGGVYMKSLTGEADYGKVAPYGGGGLIAAWIALGLLRR
ncbi:hypothetical protein TrCOL_g7367 [Triparma columacea]|uniref:Uncharacterized protein n=1 Tax=Triparma columacea TaxID=722753 RepID=A0A9W7GEY8_9STRA|nr:hypothetical protein TrCOL_g7367 [Triparma columacea]